MIKVDWLPVHQDLPLRRIKQAHQQVKCRALAAAGAADKAYSSPYGYYQIDAIEYPRPVAAVVKANIVETDGVP